MIFTAIGRLRLLGKRRSEVMATPTARVVYSSLSSRAGGGSLVSNSNSSSSRSRSSRSSSSGGGGNMTSTGTARSYHTYPEPDEKPIVSSHKSDFKKTVTKFNNNIRENSSSNNNSNSKNGVPIGISESFRLNVPFPDSG